MLARTIEQGRPGRRMPGWLKADALRPDDVKAVIAHIRALSAATVETDSRPPRWVKGDAAEGKRLFSSTCSGCHGSYGVGGEGPALNNKVLLESATDHYLIETIKRGRRGTAMSSFLDPSPVRPALTQGDIENLVAYLRSLQGGKS